MIRTYNIDEEDFEVASISENMAAPKQETTFVSLMEKAVTPEKFDGSTCRSMIG